MEEKALELACEMISDLTDCSFNCNLNREDGLIAAKIRKGINCKDNHIERWKNFFLEEGRSL